MSRKIFLVKFKKLIGETLFNYITQLRILKAQELLDGSHLSVDEISEKVGYQPEAAFNRIFKKREDLTPLKFRQSGVQLDQRS